MLASTNFRVLRGHFGGVNQLLFLPSGDLVSCSYDGAVKVWDRASGRLVADLRGPWGAVYSMALLPSGQLAAGYADGAIRIWNLEQKALARTIALPTEPSVHPAVRSLTALRGGRVAFSTCDCVIKIVDLNEEDASKPPLSIKSEGGSGDFLPLGVLSNGSLVSYHWHRTGPSGVNVWNPINGELVSSTRVEPAALADSFRVLSDDRLALGSGHGLITIVDLNDAAASSRALVMKTCHRDGVWSLAELPNGLLASGGSIQDATINVWNPADGKLVVSAKAALIGYDEHISALCVSPDGKTLASAGTWSSAIKLWSASLAN